MSGPISVAIESVLTAVEAIRKDLLPECQRLIHRIRKNCRELRHAEKRSEVFAYSCERANAERDRELLAHVSEDLDYWT